ncbi:MAG: methyltransferase domain-containing protein [Gammaproteobacteria bacterium]|nr:methyltransferase domain-containing protein [Gammaproteobacteria bacterium]
MTIKWPHVEVDPHCDREDVNGVKEFYSDSHVQARDFDGAVPFYVDCVTQLLVSMEPGSLFEFGCNAGRNLHLLSQKLPHARLYGVDVNRDAIDFGREYFNLPIEYGDELFLEKLAEDSFEVTFTVSVLDHIPFIEEVARKLIQITSRYLVLYEICYHRFGKITQMATADGEIVDGYPFSYFHDYDGLFRKLGTWCVLDVALPAFPGNLGEFYRLKVFSKHSADIGKQLLKRIAFSPLHPSSR